MNAFCASENFDAFIVFRSSQPKGKYPENSNSKWSSFQEADHFICPSFNQGQTLGVQSQHVMV